MRFNNPIHRILSIAIITVLFLINAMTGFGQLDAVVVWDLKEDTIGKLPYDVPFIIKLKTEESYDDLESLIIWSLDKNKNYATIDDIIDNGEIHFKSPISSKLTANIGRNLSFPKGYGIAISAKRNLTKIEKDNLIAKIDVNEISKQISSEIMEIVSQGDNEVRMNHFINNGVDNIIRKAINTDFPNYLFEGLKGDSKIFDSLIIWKNNSRPESERIDIITQDIADRITKFAFVTSIFASTFANETSGRFLEKTYAVFGAGITLKNGTYAVTNIGFNYFFLGYNDKVPISQVDKNFGRRLSLHASINFINLSDGFLDKKKRFGLFLDQSLFLGAGFLIDDGILLNGGVMLYREVHVNPLITEKSLRYPGFLSINIDSRLWNRFNK